MKCGEIFLLAVVLVYVPCAWGVRPEEPIGRVLTREDLGVVAAPPTATAADYLHAKTHLSSQAEEDIRLPGNSQAWQKFIAKTGPGWSVRWNPRRGNPHLVTGKAMALGLTEKLNAGNVESACRDFIGSNAELLKAPPGQLRLAGKAKAHGRWNAWFQQVHNGVPVLGGQVRMSFTDDDRLISFGSDAYPEVSVDTVPKVGKKNAIGLARKDCQAASEDQTKGTELCILPQRRPQGFNYLLCWKMYVHQMGVQKKWEYLIDAASGRIISKRNALVYQDVTGTVSGEYKPEFGSDPTMVDTFAHEDVTASGPEVVIVLWDWNSYYDPNDSPGWSTEGQWEFGIPAGGGGMWGCGDPTGGYTGDYVYGYNLAGDYENSMGAYHLTTPAIDCTGHNNVNLNFMRWLGVEYGWFDNASIEVSNNGSTWTTIWANAEDEMICDSEWVAVSYDISAVADQQPTVYVRWTMGPTDGSVTFAGWNIDDVSIVSYLGGRNTVQSQVDGSYSVEATWDPTTIMARLEGLYCDINYECGSDALYQEPGVAPGGVADILWDSNWYNRIDESSVYRHTNLIHDYYLAMDPSLGDPSPRFPQGMNYRMPVTVQLGCDGGYCNAYWDGQGMAFGAGDGSYCDSFGLYSEIVYHEYTHGVSDRIYEGFYFPYAMEQGAMNEGWSDYFGVLLSESQSPLVGDGGALLPYPDGFRTLDNTYRREKDFSNGVHFDSQMFSGSLWEIRQEIGGHIPVEEFDEMVHFARYAHPQTFEECMLAILIEDDTRYGDSDLSNGTPHGELIYMAFGNHGIGGLQYLGPSIVVNDSNGNNNGELDPGETALLSLSLINGWADATNISATLSSMDPFVTVTKADATFPDVLHGQTTSNAADAFVVSLSPDCPGTYTINLTLDVSADGPHSYSRSCLLTYAVTVNQQGYDDGQVDGYFGTWWSDEGMAVRITPEVYPCFPTHVRLFPYIPYDPEATITLRVWDDDGTDGTPGTLLGSMEVTIPQDASNDWYDIDISPISAIIYEGDFYIGFAGSDVTLFANGLDMDPPYYGRSWYFSNWGDEYYWYPFEQLGLLSNLMMRVRYIYASENGPVENLNSGERYDFIQHAIFQAEDGDEIVVAPGLYNENVNYMGKRLVVRSTDPTDSEVVAATVINAGARGAAVTFASRENRFCRLSGFTISGATISEYDPNDNPHNVPPDMGSRSGAVACFNLYRSGPVISHCVIKGNEGPAIYSYKSGPTVTNCTLIDNDGNGVEVYGRSFAGFSNCAIVGNTGHGVFGIDLAMTNCTIVGNILPGIAAYGFNARNCILWDNDSASEQPQQIVDLVGAGGSVTYSDIQGGWPGEGNIDADPCFVQLGTWDPPPLNPEAASDPNPSDGAANVDPNVVLSWSPGLSAVSHDVYFAALFDDVNNATTDSAAYMGNQDSNMWDIANYDPCGLAPGTTYFWRIDEVNDSHGHNQTRTKGTIWSMSTEDPNLVGWWRFDEGDGSTAMDSSPFGHHGNISGQVFWTEGLGDGHALEFVNGEVIVEDSNELRPMHQVTISAWVNGSALPGDAVRITAKGVDNRETFLIEVGSHVPDVFGFIVRADGDEDTLPKYTLEGGTMRLDEWVHVAGTYNGTEIMLYTDGQARNSWQIGSIVLSQDTGDMGIGNAADVPREFQGIIDDVRVYNRGFSPGKILSLYQQGSAGDEALLDYGGDYHLRPDSPCIDAGNSAAAGADLCDLDSDGNTVELTPWDLDCNRRQVDFPGVPNTGNGPGPIVDMGAYEGFLPTIEVPLRFTPVGLNLNSKGNWVKAHLLLPEGIDAADVNTSVPIVVYPQGAEAVSVKYFKRSGLVEVEADFARSDLCGFGPFEGSVIVEGVLTNGQHFAGEDHIKVVTSSFEYLDEIAAHWLRSDCDNPKWCDGLDLNRDSIVNFYDWALLDGCCIEIDED